MMASNENDILLLSAYIDNELTEEERQLLEARLRTDPELQAELSSLQQTVALIQQMPILKAPHNYTLDPAKYVPQKVVDARWRFAPIMAALAAALVIVIGIGFFLNANENQAGDFAAEAPASVDLERDETAGRMEEPREQTDTQQMEDQNQTAAGQAAVTIAGEETQTSEALESTIQQMEIAALPSPTALSTQTAAPTVTAPAQVGAAAPAQGDVLPPNSGGGIDPLAQKSPSATPATVQLYSATDTANLITPDLDEVDTMSDTIATEESADSALMQESAPADDFSTQDNVASQAPQPEGAAPGIMAVPTTVEDEAEGAAESAFSAQPAEEESTAGDGLERSGNETDEPAHQFSYAQMLRDQLLNLIRRWFNLS